MRVLSLSPLTVNTNTSKDLLLAGNWCLTPNTLPFLKDNNISYEVFETRERSKEEYVSEADTCLLLYDKYINILRKELNKIHSVSYSVRYWDTLLNRFLYPLVASLIDKYFLLESISKKTNDLRVEIINIDRVWIDPHTCLSFGSSHLLHLLLFSILAKRSGLLPVEVIDDDLVEQALLINGDGKKDLRSKQEQKKSVSLKSAIPSLKFLGDLKRASKGELPLWMFKYTRSNVLALGNQYLSKKSLDKMLASVDNIGFSYYAREWCTKNFDLRQKDLRDSLNFGGTGSQFEYCLQDAIRILLPTVYLENFDKAVNIAQKQLPKKKAVILNSQSCSGRELLDFYIAESVEKNNSHHLMVMHGGGYGVWDISIQEKVWARFSDTYSMWSNEKEFGKNCKSVKMPALRFHDWQNSSKKCDLGNDILFLVTGYYPYLYSYDSTFPRTVDESYEDWQIRFLSSLDQNVVKSTVVRDYHRYSDISKGAVLEWATKNKVKVSKKGSFAQALKSSKLAVSTYTSTTFFATLIADHPAICYWNPKTNMIREDLKEYFDLLEQVGILHYSPESASKKLNDIFDNVNQWWQSKEVRNALSVFKKNVCYTSPDALTKWSDFIRAKI